MLNVLYFTSRAEDARLLSSMSRGLWSIVTPSSDGAAPGSSRVAGRTVVGFDVVLFDPAITGMNVMRVLSSLAAIPACPPIVAVTRETSVTFARMAERFGVREYAVLPCDFERLRDLVARAIASRAERRFGACGTTGLVGECASRFVGSGSSARRLLETVARVARSVDPVLIVGATGTGKELVARMIHDNSPAAAGPLHALNVTCIPETLAESHLFGSARGGFTGAVDTRGAFEAAHGGTLFLDEIGALPLLVQPKLLRVLEDGEVRRVGSCAMRKVSFRLICATNEDLFAKAEARLFRSDLLYRINVLRVELPPLCERDEDIELLAAERLAGYRKRLSRASLDKLRAHRWPGNVRELNSCLARAANASAGDVIYPGEIQF